MPESVTTQIVAGPALGTRRARWLLMVLAGLSALAPLTTDLYLPALPRLRSAFGASVASTEVTMTTCLLGIAAGQLLIGPLTDAHGRRRPLLSGLIAFAVASIGCAVAPSVAVLDVMRGLQGVAGATGIVIARAMVHDLYSGDQAARLYALVGAVIPVAPIIAPTAGGWLLLLTSWRGIFGVQAIAGIALLATVAGLRETLPASARQPSSVRTAVSGYGVLLRDRTYVRLVAAAALGFAVFFAYISASSFVFQSVLGLSSQAFGMLFAFNGCGLLVANVAQARLAGVIPARRLMSAGLSAVAVAGALSAIAAVFHPTVWTLEPLMFVIVSVIGLVVTNTLTISMTLAAGRTGSAAGLLGTVQFVVGACVAPVVGIAGASAVPMGIAMGACGLGAACVGHGIRTAAA